MVVTILLFLLCLHSARAGYVGVGLFILSDMDAVQDPKIMDVMLNITLNYDLIALHGNINKNGLKLLLEELKKKDSTYQKVITNYVMRAGRIFPESVGFLYRSRVVGVSKMSVDKDSSIYYSKVNVTSNSKTYQFVYADVDIAASAIFQQLNGLPSAYDRIATNTGLKDVMFAGNFWTGQPRMSKDKFNDLAVTKDQRFTWYIDYKDNDVAEPNFNDAFSRLLGTGEIREHVVPKSDTVYNFNKLFKLTVEESDRISSFYPIGLKLHF